MTKKRWHWMNAVLAAVLLVPPGVVLAQQDELLKGKLYRIDRAHSLLDFTVRQLGFARIRGTFNNYRAAFYYVEDDLTQSSVHVLIDAKSIDTGAKQRDDHLRSKDFFDVEQFPRITFHSEQIEKSGNGWVAVGPLTIRDVTREVRIPFSVVSGDAEDQFANRRIAFEGELILDRKDFGVVGPTFWNNLISEQVTIEMAVAGRIFNYLNPFSRWRDKSIGKAVLDAVENSGLEAAQRLVRSAWLENQGKDYYFQLGELFKAGMQLAQSGKAKEAIGIFEIALEIYGDSADPDELSELHVVIATNRPASN